MRERYGIDGMSQPQRRNYALPPARPPAAKIPPGPMPSPSAPQQSAPKAVPSQSAVKKSSYLLQRYWKIALGSLIVLVLIGGVLLWLLKPSHPKVVQGSNGLPVSVTSQIQGFKAYYFSGSLPFGYQLVSQTVSYQTGMLVFNLKSLAGKMLIFNERSTPPNYNYQNLSAYKQFATPNGKAYVGNVGTRTVGDLFTGNKTWVLINSPSSIDMQNMQTILDDLAPVQ